ncbi:MAG: SDR family NAD(P)-dependent oxidoreductase, partial [Simkania sp.]|nr:SDR family NAD(P)-dependent oxidoreductase [Simkania sp.]
MCRRVLITGTSSGIGLAITNQLLAAGHEVWGLARNPQESKHPFFHPCAIDLSDLDALPDKLEPFLEVDALICNVGRGQFGNLEEFSYKQIRSLMDLNFLSHVFLIKKLLPHLKKQKRADIVFFFFVASLAGKQKGTIYCASKFALRGFAQSLRE